MRIISLVLMLGVAVFALPAQTLELSLPQLLVAPNATTEAALRVKGFNDIVSFQFSVNWDTTVVRLEAADLADLPFVAIGRANSSQGELRVSWFSDTGDGKDLMDGSSLLQLRFRALGPAGSVTPLSLTDVPLLIQVFRSTATPGEFEAVPLDTVAGEIRIALPVNATVNQENTRCFADPQGSIQLNISGDTSAYRPSWTGPGGFTAVGYQLSDLPAGEYLLTLRDLMGATILRDTVRISGPTVPFLITDIVTRPAGCDNNAGQATVQVSGGSPPLRYRIQDRTNSDGQFGQLAAGNYGLRVTDANGCETTDTVVITAPDRPAVDLGLPVRQLCNGDEIILMATLQAGETVRWSTGSTQTSISVRTPGQYVATVTNATGCNARDSVEVVPGERVDAQIENDELAVCPGDTLQLRVSGGETYRWLNPQGVLTGVDRPDPRVFPDSSTVFVVVVSTECASDTLEVPVVVYEVLATAGPDTCIAPGDMVMLSASGGLFYEWLPSRFPVTDPSSATPTATPEDSVTYVVNITDVNGCITTDSLLVLVASNPELTIDAINVITPNGDGMNDVLEFSGTEKYGNNSLKVYNRWGNLIYQKINYQTDEDRFDGTYRGELLPAGNYFYVLSFSSGEIKQTLLLVRE